MEYTVKYTDENRIAITKENEALGFRVGSTETFPDGSKEFTFTDFFPEHSPVPENFKASYAEATTHSKKLAVIARLLEID